MNSWVAHQPEQVREGLFDLAPLFQEPHPRPAHAVLRRHIGRLHPGIAVEERPLFAKRCGTCPIPASSGMTTGRHRLNRGGHRHANAALYRAVIVRMRYHQPTRDYVARRTADGRTKREIIRCLKRVLAREIYQRVMTDFRARQKIIQAA